MQVSLHPYIASVSDLHCYCRIPHGATTTEKHRVRDLVQEFDAEARFHPAQKAWVLPRSLVPALNLELHSKYPINDREVVVNASTQCSDTSKADALSCWTCGAKVEYSCSDCGRVIDYNNSSMTGIVPGCEPKLKRRKLRAV